VRYEAILRGDGCCEACGRGKPHGVVINVDHILSRRKRPDLALVLSNLQVLCHDCNHGKGNWDSTDWRNRTPTITPEEREWEREAWERFE
jgi:5-methylcytosine-specific restriction endonuclease McrA